MYMDMFLVFNTCILIEIKEILEIKTVLAPKYFLNLLKTLHWNSWTIHRIDNGQLKNKKLTLADQNDIKIKGQGY